MVNVETFEQRGRTVERYLGGQLKGAAPCRESQAHGHGSLVSSPDVGETEYEQDERGRLCEEAEMLRRQLDEVTSRLQRLGR
jgi:hypothetical protein